MHESRAAGLRKAIEEATAELAAAHAQHAQYVGQMRAFAARVEGVKADNARRRADMDAFTASLSAQAAVVAELQRLVALSEALKGQLAAFERSCARQAEELRVRVGTMRSEGDALEAATLGDAERKRLQAMRQMAARKGRAVLLLKRKLDEVPTHAELAQYARMLLELYEQINSKCVVCVVLFVCSARLILLLGLWKRASITTPSTRWTTRGATWSASCPFSSPSAISTATP